MLHRLSSYFNRLLHLSNYSLSYVRKWALVRNDKDRREAEEAMKEAKERRSLVENVVEAIFRINEENHLSPQIKAAFTK